VTYLAELNTKTDLTVELGLQSAHDETLRHINRGHDFAAFRDGYERLQNAGIPVCIHIINGLPTKGRAVESKEQMLYTAATVAALRPAFLKIHMLHILDGTPMADDWRKGEVSLLTQEEYVDTVCDQLALLPPETVICRLTGDGIAEDLLAPEYSKRKIAILNDIDKLMFATGATQGCNYKKI
jgi:radical SAM protein (TIGR01212 family)